jgi:FkbM family methyltransferase
MPPLFLKLSHLIRRWRYIRTVKQLTPIAGGTGACGQDLLVLELLGGRRDGTFVDIGANDGVSISNTLHLEREFGWSGLAIEPLPSIYEKLTQARKCHTLNACVSDKAGQALFTEVVGGVNMYSGLSGKMDRRHRRRIDRSIHRSGRGSVREIQVECVRWADALARFSIREVDFLSLDTEGGELDILRTINFDSTPVRVISVENNYYTHDYAQLLEPKGFRRVGAFRVDEIYARG